MITYLLVSRFSECAVLSPPQRRFVWRHCVHPLLTRFPIMLAKTVLLFVLLIAAYWLGAFGSLASSILTTVLTVMLVPELMDVCLIARHRQDIESYIHSHVSEISSVA